MNTIARTTAVLLFALLPLSPAALASERGHGGDWHDGRPDYHDRHYGHHHDYYHHHHRHGWHHRHHRHHHGHEVYDGYQPGYRVVLPAPPLPPVIVPPHVLLHPAR